MTNEEIKTLALACGFTERPQDNGRMDLNPYVYESHKKAYDMGFAEGSKHGEWQTADIKPPEDDGFYLVFTEHGRIGECRFLCDDWATSYVNFEKVIAWQELPKAPNWWKLPTPPSEVQSET